MTPTVIEKHKKIKTRFSKKDIPKSLIYEEYAGKPLYYRGFKEVMIGLKTFEQIMGQSDTQAIIHGIIMNFLIKNIDEQAFFAIGNETGFHLSKKNNVSSDIVIYDKQILQNHQTQDKYFEIPPLSIIEIDIQGDTSEFGISELDYYSMKTKALLDFGAKEVLWFFSKTKQIFVAKPEQNWLIMDWNNDLCILENYTFNMGKELIKSGWKL